MTAATGLGVDATGGPVIDPTANVLSLVEAAVKRLDDMLSAETRRQNDLREQSEKYAADTARLVMEFQEKLREAEAKRIDAMRVVDVNAVSVERERAGAQAAVLASQVQASAEALRALVAATQSALASQQAASNAEITKRLSELERAKYEGAGRSTVADPMLTELVAEMKSLRESRAVGVGKSAGVGAVIGYIFGGVGLLAAVFTLILKFAG